MIELHNIEQGTEEWLELRNNLYTGSGAEKLLRYSGQLKVIDGVASAYALNEITGFKGNFYTKRGHLLEDEAIELYQKIKGEVGIRFEDRKVGFVTNSEFPNCGYSPDDLYPDRTVECKAFGEKLHLQMYHGNIPLKVLSQCHFGMVICNKKLCDLVIYNPNFAKKKINGEDNPNYNPKLAYKIIEIKLTPSIAANFRKKLKPRAVTA